MAHQRSLAGMAPALPDGMSYEPDVLTPDEERALVAACAALPLATARYRGYVAKRRIASFGSGYDFERNTLTDAPAIPSFLMPLRESAASRAGLASGDFTHALVTEYRPGTELGWHRDVPEFGVVVGVSLLSACRMRLRPYPPGRQEEGARTQAVELAARSLYVLRGAARWRWQHSIAPTSALRYSITFRTRSRWSAAR